MRLILDQNDLVYETGNLCFLFFPGERVGRISRDAGQDAYGVNFIIVSVRRHRSFATALVVISRPNGRHARAHCRFDAVGPDFIRQSEHAVGRAFYRAASAVCGFTPPWGTLTGIRPVKLMREALADGRTPSDALRFFRDEYFVSDEKAALCLETAAEEQKIVALSRPESFSLYISIPFCPSRCAYCSFVSHDIEKAARLLPDYVRLLCEELRATGALAASLGLRLETVYIGGGTPTVLFAEQLTQIMDAVKESFTFSTLREYTVEAGRPDTVTPEKLEAILRGGATRISINPQTMDDDILRAVGRRHTAKDIADAFELARRAGVPSINADLIAGLPGDTPENFRRTLSLLLALRPEAVTVHTLALKRASRLVTSGEAEADARGENVRTMLESASAALHGAGMRPYYLYRQRNTVGNLENVGWSLPGHEGLYNVFIMDETHTVLAAGAGGATKLRQPGGTRIERVFNYKYPYEYISRFTQILDRKKQVVHIYDEFGWKRKN